MTNSAAAGIQNPMAGFGKSCARVFNEGTLVSMTWCADSLCTTILFGT
jgi:hypothetical protein